MLEDKQEKINKEIPRLNDLPSPYEGVADEIFFDLFSNRQVFVSQALGNLRDENPDLCVSFIKDLMTSPNHGLSLEWSLTYYEIFSRAARRMGKRMPLVSSETIQSVWGQEFSDLKLGMWKGDQGVSESLQAQENQFMEKTREEVDKSSELGEFWSALLIHMGTLVTTAPNPSEVGRIHAALKWTLNPLYHLRLALYAQCQANKLNQDFPNIT